MLIKRTQYCAIYDDILTAQEQIDIQNIINLKKLKFQSCDYSVGPELTQQVQDTNCKEHPQLSATIIENDVACNRYSNEFAYVFKKFLSTTKLECKNVFRIKLNIQERADEWPSDRFLTPHVDLDIMHNVLIYYPFDSDGNTLLFKKENDQYQIVECVVPKQGRFLLFSGDQYHSGQPPVTSAVRMVLNIDFR